MNETKSYLQNVSLKFISGAVGFLLFTTSSILVARVLGPEGHGTAVLLLLIPNMVIWLVNGGIGQANGYLVGSKTYPLQTLWSNSLALIAGISLVTGLVYWLALPFSGSFLTQTGLTAGMLATAFFLIPITLAEQYWEGLLLGLERIPHLALVTIIRFSALLCLNLGLVWWLGLGVWGVIIAAIVSSGLCAATYLYFLSNQLQPQLRGQVAALRAALLFGIQGHLGNILHFLNLRLDVFILSYFAGARSVGLYAVATVLAELLTYFSASFSFVLFPRTAASDPQTASRFTPKVARLSLFITVLAALGLLSVSKPLLLFLYSEAFLPALYPLWILIPGIVGVGFAGVIYSDLGGRGKPYYSTLGAVVSLIITVGLDAWLIPYWDTLGAATASSMAYLTNAALAMSFYLKETGAKPADLILIRPDDIRAGLSEGYTIALTLTRQAKQGWRPLKG